MEENPRAIVIGRAKRRLKILGALLLAIVLLLAVVYFAAPQWLLEITERYQAQRAQLVAKYVQVDGTRWSYYDGGKGPPLLLLHGYMADKTVWLQTARYLTPNFRVIAPDLPGSGDSPRAAGDYGYAAQAERVRAFVQALHLGGIAIAGHSMGGGIAGVYASKYPQDVAALILMDSAGAPFKDNDFTRELKAGKNPFDLRNRADFEKLEQLVFAQPPWLPPRIEDVFVDRARSNHAFDDRVMRELTEPDQRNALTAALPSVTAPTLAIWCRQDQIIDISALDSIRDALSSAPKIGVTELNGCGHMSILERPREVADAITHFVLMP